MTPGPPWPAGQARGQRSGRSAGRTVVSWLLWGVAAFLLLLGVAGIALAVNGNGGAQSAGTVGFVFVVALFTGSGARTVAKGGRRVVTGAFGSGAPASGTSGQLLVTLPAADPQITYRERCSQFPVTGATADVVLLAASVAGIPEIGGPKAEAAAGLAFAVAFISAVILILVLIDLPNGIEVSAGRFAVGVRGVPPAGRLWRHITGPLDAVLSWDVLPPEQVRRLHRERRARAPSGRQLHLGDLRLFARRQCLRLVVDPGSVTARLPARILHGYQFVNVAQAGAVWDGSILIGTRRPGALTAALEQALPGRREANSAE